MRFIPPPPLFPFPLFSNANPSDLSDTDGTTIYITRDIGAAKERAEKFKFDKMIYVVASQQNLHLAQFFKVLELMNFDWAKGGRLEHINFGMG